MVSPIANSAEQSEVSVGRDEVIIEPVYDLIKSVDLISIIIASLSSPSQNGTLGPHERQDTQLSIIQRHQAKLLLNYEKDQRVLEHLF